MWEYREKSKNVLFVFAINILSKIIDVSLTKL